MKLKIEGSQIKEHKFELIGIYIYTIILLLAYILIYKNNSQWKFGFEANFNI